MNVSGLVLQLHLPIILKPGDKEDVVGAAPTGDAPTTSEWSTILLLAKVRLILETLRYIVPNKALLDVPCLIFVDKGR